MVDIKFLGGDFTDAVNDKEALQLFRNHDYVFVTVLTDNAVTKCVVSILPKTSHQ